MIVGTGVDLVAIPRMQALWNRHGAALARRLLAQSERADLDGHRDPARLLAKRFAAKEALAKALGIGLRAPMGLQAVSVCHDALGAPAFVPDAALSEYLAARGVQRVHLTLTDEREAALAFVILES